MPPKYKLTYFDIKGVGEPVRFFFHYGGIQFEDIRISFEEWPKLKATTPFGKMPLLETDGEVIPQGASIARYVAKIVGLYPKDDLEALKADSVVDTIVDLRLALADQYFEPDDAAKQKKKEVLQNQTIPQYLSGLDALVKKNGGHFVDGKLTWADVYFAAYHETLNAFAGSDIIKKYPNLQALADQVYQIPNIKAWVSKRPKSDM